MADEIQFRYEYAAGLSTVYAVMHAPRSKNIIRVSDGQPIARSAANWPDAGIALSDSDAPPYYVGSVPAGTPGSLHPHVVEIFLRSGATRAITDTRIGEPLNVWWNGAFDAGGPRWPAAK